MIPTLLFSAALAATSGAPPLPADQQPVDCTRCAEWNARVEPYRLADNTWYVGMKGVSSVLIVDDEGLVLIDGGLPQSAAIILDNVRKAGFDPKRIRWILDSHAHFDHAGGIAALARLTGAKVAAGRDSVAALTHGRLHPDDPQAGYGARAHYPPVAHVRAIDDGDTITLGRTVITAVASSGHAPGGMSWRWRSCSGEACRDIVYLDSLNAVSTRDYRFSDHPKAVATLRATIERLATLPCDVAVAAHPEQLPAATPSTTACAAYAGEARENLRKRLREEQQPPPRA